MVSDLRRTWSDNSADLEFDLDCEGVLGGPPALTELDIMLYNENDV